MKIAGIIAEYNPFHSGHARHIDLTRAATGCDFVVACVAGHFTQRGDPALMSKWARARMAMAGDGGAGRVDAVVELPAMFAVRTADAFARGGVAILGGIGADVLSFGSETEDMGILRALADLRASEPPSLSEAVRRGLDAGRSHARARGEAIGEYLGVDPALINRPNMILAAEYLRAIDACAPGMAPVVIRRDGDYHGESLKGTASASAIRAALARGETEAALAALPAPARDHAELEPMHAMDDMLMLRLREMTPEAMAALPDVGEGLEHRLYALCRERSTREGLLEALKCKRYTRARLSRLLTHALLGMTQSRLEATPMPRYARLLGVRRGAEALLTELKARSAIPLVSNAGELRGDTTFELECRATDTWALLHDAPERRLPGREFTEKFIRIE